MTQPPAVRASGLTKRFGTRTAFEDLSFEVAGGEVFGFLGPNGAGKTTTVRVLATLLSPTAGSAEVAGVPVTPGNGPEIRRRISVMPEAAGLYLKLTVLENLELFAGLYGIPRGVTPARIEESLEAVGLGGRSRDLAGSLSKGLRQRAALARALLPRPSVLFLDEPTSGLDPEAALEVRELLAGVRQGGATVFLTTHRLEEAERLCDRVAILNTRLRSIGRPTELQRGVFASSVEVGVVRPLADPAGVFEGLPGVLRWQAQGDTTYVLEVSDVATAAPAVTRALVRAEADVLRVAEVRHSLEDVYLELVGDES